MEMKMDAQASSSAGSSVLSNYGGTALAQRWNDAECKHQLNSGRLHMAARALEDMRTTLASVSGRYERYGCRYSLHVVLLVIWMALKIETAIYAVSVVPAVAVSSSNSNSPAVRSLCFIPKLHSLPR
jgi:hypothetical protein